jgi:hypothetical protein
MRRLSPPLAERADTSRVVKSRPKISRPPRLRGKRRVRRSILGSIAEQAGVREKSDVPNRVGPYHRTWEGNVKLLIGETCENYTPVGSNH